SHPREWVVGSDPTYRQRPPGASFEFHQRELVDSSDPAYGTSERNYSNVSALSTSGLDLNHPPTPVGGIANQTSDSLHCRLDLNHRPTAVGGIQTFEAKPITPLRINLPESLMAAGRLVAQTVD